jgi:methylenetetrahydrofolate reductase (NADPH)
MNFSEFYQGDKPRFSFEVFPPKEDAGVENLLGVLKKLSIFNPAFISVTYGAMGSTRDLTRDLALRIRRETELTTAFHFTCVGADRESIRQYVEQLKKEGLNLIVALRGDPPPGGTFVVPQNGFAYANELVTFLKERDGFSLAVAGYPEGHVEATSLEDDLKNLKRKVDAGADVILTQLFFDNQKYFDFVERAQAAGIRVPIVPGIMPVLNLKQVEKITGLCGASLPKDLHEKLIRSQNDPEAMRRIGVKHAISQCRELIDRDVPGVHFYILNRAESTVQIIESLKV